VSVAPRTRLKPAPPAAPASSRRYQSLGYRAKSVLLGPALKTAQLAHERISKRVALAVFSSDPISSTAYATEEILLVLVGAGLAGGVLATGLALPVALAIVALLALLVVSYRQVVDAYPSAGGAYVVSRDNFGNVTAAVAGAALLVDYVLTVAVSVSSGVAAMASVFPEQLGPVRVEISVAFVVLLAWANLRGIREAGRIFAVPTYVYVAAVGAMIAVGGWRLATGDIAPISYSPEEAELLHHEGPLGAVTVFLVLRALASGTTALTGVEAISNGVSAFRKPEARNAKKTLMVMAAIMASLFVGVTYLAVELEALPFESGYPTVISQIARQVLGSGPAFILVQAATLLILVLAANTAFSGFPLLASFASGDALLPRQLRKRGHRLVYSNGILALAAVASFLIVAFRADTHDLIPLYAVGVVTSFTLAQAGMTRRHLRRREPGWRSGILVNGVGAAVTGVALVVIMVGKFADGAWMVVVAIPLLVWLLLRIQRTYVRELAQLKVESHRLAPPKPRHEVIVLIEDLDQAALSALQYARQLNPLSITAMHVAVDPDHARELGRLWARVDIPFPLELVDAPDRNLLATVEETVAERVRSDTEVTVLVPRRRYVGFWRRVLHDQTSAGLTKVLGTMQNVNVTIVPFHFGPPSQALRAI
jgi:amino acid transporter